MFDSGPFFLKRRAARALSFPIVERKLCDSRGAPVGEADFLSVPGAGSCETERDSLL
jgi:hypothetical protein